MRNFDLSVVAPDRSVVETSITSVILPGLDGYFGVMGGHAPLISALKPGIIEYIENNQRELMVVGGGFCEVTGERVTILADSAEFAHELDSKKEAAALEEARKALRGEASSLSSEQATLEIERAVERLKLANRRSMN